MTLNTNLEVLYHFTGNVNDSSGNGRNASNTGATLTTDKNSVSSQAYQWDGINDYMTFPNSVIDGFDDTSDCSMNFWVRFDTVSSREDIIARTGSDINTYAPFGVIIGLSSGSLRVNSTKQGVANVYQIDTANGEFTTGVWYMITIVQDSSSYKLYKDTVLIGEDTTKGTTGSTTGFNGTYFLGSSGTFKFGGKMDEVRVYSKALTYDEILQLFKGYDTDDNTVEGTQTINNIGYWKFDTNNSTQTDATGTGNDLTVTGATFTSSGIINGGYDYDGNDRMEKTNGINPGTTISVSAWFKTNSAANKSIVAMDDRTSGNPKRTFQMQYSNNFFIYFWDNSTGGFKGSTWVLTPDNAWHHLVMTLNGTTTHVYFDGVEQSQNYGGGSFSGVDNWSADFLVGAAQSNPSGSYDRYFVGTIDEVGIWSRELSSSEVTELYNSGAGLQYPFTSDAEEARNSLFTGSDL